MSERFETKRYIKALYKYSSFSWSSPKHAVLDKRNERLFSSLKMRMLVMLRYQRFNQILIEQKKIQRLFDQLISR